MGAAARKLAHTATHTRPALRLVHGTRRGARRRSSLQASQAFRIAACCFVVIAFAGVMRVSLAASAAESTIDAWKLRAEVKAERLAGRTLEADRSALAAPSRIEAVALETLNMTKPSQVSYVALPEAETRAEVASLEPSGPSGRELLATLVDLAAGEAQVMLVGDVGLGSSR